MANVMDYMVWRGDLSFKKSQVNVVDLVAISQIVLLDLSSAAYRRKQITLRECATRYFKHEHAVKALGYIYPRKLPDLLKQMAESVRFGDMLISGYVEDIDESTETQFSALTLEAQDIKTLFVVFSGTDDTIVGWKENFNLIYKTPTPAQLHSVKYLNSAVKHFDGKVVVLGHSKGGHLAMYSAMHCEEEVRRKIFRVVNLDGPGIPDNMEDVKLMERIEKKVVSFVPQSSVIGRLFEKGGRVVIVHSTNKVLLQHDCFSWLVGPTELVQESEFSDIGCGVDASLRRVLDKMDAKEREAFVDGVFKILAAASCKTLTDVASSGPDIIKAYFKQTFELKKTVNKALLSLMADKYVRKFALETMKEFSKEKKQKIK